MGKWYAHNGKLIYGENPDENPTDPDNIVIDTDIISDLNTCSDRLTNVENVNSNLSNRLTVLENSNIDKDYVNAKLKLSSDSDIELNTEGKGIIFLDNGVRKRLTIENDNIKISDEI